jgi:hypothetical protein
LLAGHISREKCVHGKREWAAVLKIASSADLRIYLISISVNSHANNLFPG